MMDKKYSNVRKDKYLLDISPSVYRIFTMTLFLSFVFQLNAQDIHFTQFNKAKTLINPAQTGAFYGTVRVGGIYRNQYNKVQGNPYSTTLLYADAPITYVSKKNRDWIGIGAAIFVDKSGLAQLNAMAGNISLAYHHSFDAGNRNVLSVGGNFGYVNRSNSLDDGKLRFEDEILGGSSSTDRNKYARDFYHSDITAGVLFTSVLKEGLKLNVGGSLAHINQPSISFEATTYDVPIRYLMHASLEKQMNERITLTPRVLYAQIGKAQQTQIQLEGGYKVNSNFILSLGLGTRLEDAVQLMIGGKYGRFDFGLSYDYTISNLSNEVSGGALEIGLAYIFAKEKKVTTSPKFICPEL